MAGVWEWLKLLNKYGVTLVQHVPTENETVVRTIRCICRLISACIHVFMISMLHGIACIQSIRFDSIRFDSLTRMTTIDCWLFNDDTTGQCG